MIIIIGAGLSGLLTGYRLQSAGIPFKILEARNRIGGRINTIYSENAAPVEMGATWFGYYHQHLNALLEELGIGYFEQFRDGTSFFQSFYNAPTNAVVFPPQPPNFRIAGGTSKLINTLRKGIHDENIMLNEEVRSIRFLKNTVEVKANEVYFGTKVVLAIPPKLWASKIIFEPKLPDDLKRIALSTHTWMENSVKVALTYKTPFWRENKQSGMLFSRTGPIIEFYDHSNSENDKFALCGFVNSRFVNMNAQERKQLIIQQVVNVFGEAAKAFTDFQEVLWQNEAHTFQKDAFTLQPHQNNGHAIYQNTFFDGKLILSASETSKVYAGYMDGAVFAAERVARLIKELN